MSCPRIENRSIYVTLLFITGLKLFIPSVEGLPRQEAQDTEKDREEVSSPYLIHIEAVTHNSNIKGPSVMKKFIHLEV